MVRKINNALLRENTWNEWYTIVLQCIALAYCFLIFIVSVAIIFETNQNTIQDNFIFYFKRNGMVWPYIIILCSVFLSMIIGAVLFSNYSIWCDQYIDKQKLLADDADYRPASDWKDIKDGTAASVKLIICYWSFLVLSFAIIPGLIVLSVVSSIIGIFHLCGHFIDYIASKTIYKPKTPERGMINEFNKLLND